MLTSLLEGPVANQWFHVCKIRVLIWRRGDAEGNDATFQPDFNPLAFSHVSSGVMSGGSGLDIVWSSRLLERLV